MPSRRIDQIFKRLAGAVVYVTASPRRTEVLQTAESSRVHVFHIDAKPANSKRKLLRVFAETFSFPQNFGNNWDALDECMRDLSWFEQRDFALVVEHADYLLALRAKDFKVLISILARATISWRAESVVFSVVLLGGPKLAAAVNTVIYQS
jgi:RNAse (barnase) inhibitor barstar